MEVLIEKPSPETLRALKSASWPVWTCAQSRFDWHYDDEETCYFHEGKVTVTAARGRYEFGAGDLVTFAKGLDCAWEVSEPVRKSYIFGLGRIKE